MNNATNQSAPVDVLGLIDRLSGRMMMSAEASVARDAIAELIDAAKDLGARGLGYWERTPGGLPCGTFTVERAKWDRYQAALARVQP